MQGKTGLRPRYICTTCWTLRQARYAANKPKDQLLKEKRESSARRKAAWSDERKKLERDKRYNNWLKRLYNITLDQYRELLEVQGGVCKICGTSSPGGRGCFHVDHCHDSLVIRGLLCSNCNMMLGLSKDSIRIFQAAISYLVNADHKLENRAADGGKKC